MDIVAGDHLLARTARGGKVPRRAVSGVVEGDAFPVVWVCGEGEYETAKKDARKPDAVPWPASAVEKA